MMSAWQKRRSQTRTVSSADLQQSNFFGTPEAIPLSAGLIVCATSLFLNVRLAERMGQLQDNDMKYRYLLMQGQADCSTLERLENKFKWQRDERFIRNLTDSVLDLRNVAAGRRKPWNGQSCLMSRLSS